MYPLISFENYQQLVAYLADADRQIAGAGGETVGYDTTAPTSGDWSPPANDNGKDKVMSAAKAACGGDQIGTPFTLPVAFSVTKVTGIRDGSESGYVSLGEALDFLGAS